jgi:lipopolysaccharide exporter
MYFIREFLRTDFFRNFLKLFTGSMFAQGLSFILSPVISRLYTAEEIGLVALYLGILNVLSVFSTAKYEQAIMLPTDDKAAVNLFSLVQIISLSVAGVVLMLVLFFNNLIVYLAGNPELSPWLYWLPLSILLHGLMQSATYLANRKKFFGDIARATVLQYSVLNIIRVVAGFLKVAFNGLIAAQIVAQFAGTLYMSHRILKKMKDYASMVSWAEMWSNAREYSVYPRYNMILNFTNNLSGALPIFMFSWGFSTEATGWYAFGYTFVFRPLSLVSQATMQVLSQKIIEDHHQGRWIYPALRKLVLRFMVIGFFPFMLLAIMGPWLFGLIFSPEYAPSGRILQLLTPWLFMVFLTSPLSFIPELFFRQKRAMIIDMIYLVLRFSALAIGIAAGRFWLAVSLFSLVSMAVVLYNLFWYLQLARKNKNDNLAVKNNQW